MSIDPETERQIAELSHDPRPLLVLDVDDVVLHFVRPFPRFLGERGFDLKLGTFRLLGNIAEKSTGRLAEAQEIESLIDEFFHAQADWQEMTDGAAEVLADFAPHAEIVMLTAMPHRYRDARRRHMDALGLPFPLLTTELAKGPAIARLRGERPRRVAFVDDQPTNLASAREHVADVHLFHLMAETKLRELLPDPPEGTSVVEDWQEARPLIASALEIPL